MCARPLPSLALGVFCASVHAQAACAAMEARWSSLPSRVWRVVWSRGARRCCSRGRNSCHGQRLLIEALECGVGAPAASPQQPTLSAKGRKRAQLGLTSSTILGLGSLGGAHPESWSIRLPRDHYTWLSLAARGAPTGNTFRPSAQVRQPKISLSQVRHPAQPRLGVRRAASPRPRPSPQRHNGWYSPSHCGVASPSQLHHGGGADGAGGGGNTHRSLSPNRLAL